MINLGTKMGLSPNEPIRPCDYFDLIAGTSTGGSVIHDRLYPGQAIESPKPPDFDKIFRPIRDWFSLRGERFLLVYDGADNIDNPDDLSNVDLRKVIPNYKSVDVLVTTRMSRAQGFGSFSVEVGEMKEEEAMQLLANSSGLGLQQLSASETEEMKNIVRELGFFALALQLTGSYVSQNPRISADLSKYLREWRKRRKQLLEITPRLADQYPMSVLISWEVTYEAVSRTSTIAANLLSFLAFLDFTKIQTSLFEEYMILLSPESGNKLMRPLSGDKSIIDVAVEELLHFNRVISPEGSFTYDDLEQAFGTLMSFSLIKRLPSQAGFSMHRLIHAWGHERLGARKKLDMIRAAVWFISCQIELDEFHPTGRRRLVPYAMAFFTILGNSELQIDIDDWWFRKLRTTCVLFLHDLGEQSNEYKMRIFILDCLRDSLGDNHTDVLATINGIAWIHHMQGYDQKAADMQRVVVERRLKLSPEGPDTLIAIDDFASMLLWDGKIDDAVYEQKRVIEGFERLYGREDVEGYLREAERDMWLRTLPNDTDVRETE
ncbi:MAG: Kinesin light chain 3 [Alectoria fallacina]|uniref:Kinesin light chain 3 n=1 Tax=Alectoria fallacina TaxID=1903189 RepID=A0A8H3EYV4_9LECA|nr:MAG: Kinesin light chain 3 [Alectoria fallacina]